MKILVIPVEGPMVEQEVGEGERGALEALQSLVGGYIEAINIPSFIRGHESGTAYINEEGKLEQLPPNMRATDFLVPGVGLFPGDYIAGTMVLAGVDYNTGKNADVPMGLVRRARLIESEAG